MTALKVSIAPAAGVAVPPGLGSLFLDVIYSRALNTETSGGLTDLPSLVQDTVRCALDGQLQGALDLPDVEQAIPAEQLSHLQATCCPMERGTMFQAARVIVQCYQELPPPLARAHAIPYSAALARMMADRLEDLCQTPVS